LIIIPGVKRRSAALNPRLLFPWRLRRKKANGSMVNIFRAKWKFPGRTLRILIDNLRSAIRDLPTCNLPTCQPANLKLANL
jgi:hypothetical protein